MQGSPIHRIANYTCPKITNQALPLYKGSNFKIMTLKKKIPVTFFLFEPFNQNQVTISSFSVDHDS